MRFHPQNPASNVLGAGITPEGLTRAIEQSGYPLQSRVVDSVLSALFSEKLPIDVQEEWSYIDSDGGQIRSLDALISAEIRNAKMPVFGRTIEPADCLRIALDLLIECKQSELPFTFFVRPTRPNRPTIAGLPHKMIETRSAVEEEGDVPFHMSVADALATHQLPLANPELTAVAMTRVYRKGKELELSGEEAFRGLAPPLLKAESHYLALTEPGPERIFLSTSGLSSL